MRNSRYFVGANSNLRVDAFADKYAVHIHVNYKPSINMCMPRTNSLEKKGFTVHGNEEIVKKSIQL